MGVGFQADRWKSDHWDCSRQPHGMSSCNLGSNPGSATGEKNEAQTGEITCLETQERCQHLPPCRTNHLSTASAFKPFILRKLEAPNLHYANSTWEVFQLANIWP
ncbi:unnamed protein product [Rangifer tarandus platyrhynchus]|uniref:Uncharacterized protein n=1 Tax=Rangifer tarandus platyrhynchus TaxID=3082113 RepID=A0AC59Z2G0_RANTA